MASVGVITRPTASVWPYRHEKSRVAFIPTQPFKGFLTSGLIVDQAEDQFAFTPGISGTDKACDIRSLHQGLQNLVLFLGALRDFIQPAFRQDRKVFKPPFGKAFIIAFRRGKLHQMADTPADQVSAAFQVAVPAFVCADHPGQGLSYTGLLGNNKFHFGLVILGAM